MSVRPDQGLLRDEMATAQPMRMFKASFLGSVTVDRSRGDDIIADAAQRFKDLPGKAVENLVAQPFSWATGRLSQQAKFQGNDERTS